MSPRRRSARATSAGRRLATARMPHHRLQEGPAAARIIASRRSTASPRRRTVQVGTTHTSSREGTQGTNRLQPVRATSASTTSTSAITAMCVPSATLCPSERGSHVGARRHSGNATRVPGIATTMGTSSCRSAERSGIRRKVTNVRPRSFLRIPWDLTHTFPCRRRHREAAWAGHVRQSRRGATEAGRAEIRCQDHVRLRHRSMALTGADSLARAAVRCTSTRRRQRRRSAS